MIEKETCREVDPRLRYGSNLYPGSRYGDHERMENGKWQTQNFRESSIQIDDIIVNNKTVPSRRVNFIANSPAARSAYPFVFDRALGNFNRKTGRFSFCTSAWRRYYFVTRNSCVDMFILVELLTVKKKNKFFFLCFKLVSVNFFPRLVSVVHTNFRQFFFVKFGFRKNTIKI